MYVAKITVPTGRRKLIWQKTTTSSTTPKMSVSESCGILFAGQGTDVRKSVHKLTSGPWAKEAKAYFARASEVTKFLFYAKIKLF
jgi:hypothetical protein